MKSPQNFLAVSAHPEGQNPAPLDDHAWPMRFVYRDDNGMFKMNPEAADSLRRIKGPVAVVSLWGPDSKGKNFVLNQLLAKSSGLQVESTHRPCAGGIWLWSTPGKQTTLDGTEYSLLLLDIEGFDSFDQTGLYITQIFSLVILLSNMLIYNQTGAIDENALDHLSLVPKITGQIHVSNCGAKATPSELGPFSFSPIFVWLLREFCEGDEKQTTRDYLEQKLRPLPDDGNDLACKNQIRESIKVLFPDRECFALGSPFINKNGSQHLGQISLKNLQSEFRTRIDALTKYVFGRTRPKQVGGTIMTGPILAGITTKFLDALKDGLFPTISSSWKSTEELECKRAYDTATEVYLSAFDRARPPEEAFLREAHDEAVRKSVLAFNVNAVGTGSVRHKYEVLLHNFVTRVFQDYKTNALREADLRCLSSIQGLEKKLRAASQVPNAKLDDVVTALDGLVSEYESSVHGPTKWKMLSCFLRKSFQDVILNQAKKQIDLVLSEKSTLMLKCRSFEDKIELVNKQLGASEKVQAEYQSHYQISIDDIKKLSGSYDSRITDLDSKCRSLEDRCSSLLQTLDSSRQEFFKLKERYEELLSKKKMDEETPSAKQEAGKWKERYDAAVTEAQIANEKILAAQKEANELKAEFGAAKEKAVSSQKEAYEWKNLYDAAVREAQISNEKVLAAQKEANKMKAEFDAANENVLSAKKEAYELKNLSDAAVREAQILNEKVVAAQNEAIEMKAELDAVNEKVLSAKKEACEWKNLYDASIKEAEAAKEKALSAQKESYEFKDKLDVALKEIASFKSSCREIEEKNYAADEKALSAQKEAIEWKDRYDAAVGEAKRANEKILSAEKEANELRDKFEGAIREVAILKFSSREAEKKTSVAGEKALSAQKEATEWKENYNAAVTETKTALQKAAALREHVDALKIEFSKAEQEDEIDDWITKLEGAELNPTNLSSEFPAIVSEIENCDLESLDLLSQIRELSEILQSADAGIESLRKEAQLLVQQKTQLKEQLLLERKIVHDLHLECKDLENQAKMANDSADKARMNELAAQNERNDFHLLAVERLSEIENAGERIKNIEREKMLLLDKIEKHTLSSQRAKSKLALLQATIKEKDDQIESLFNGNNNQMNANNYQMQNSLQVHRLSSKSETMAYVLGAKDAAEASSAQIIEHNNEDFLWQESTPTYLDESAVESRGKRSRQLEAPSEDSSMDQSMETIDGIVGSSKRARTTMAPLRCTMSEDVSFSEGTEGISGGYKVDSANYAKFTVARLRAELTEQGFVDELRQLRSRRKKDVLELYEKLILHK